MNKIGLYSVEGAKLGETNIPDAMAQMGSINLLAQAIHVYQDRRHPGTKDAKTRAEVNITKKKIYKQKGTGGARHGASSAHIFVGGGVAHGPKSVKRILSLPQAMRVSALKTALARKIEEGRVVAVENLSGLKKTRQAQRMIESVLGELKVKYPSRILVVFASEKGNTLVFRNIKGVFGMGVKNLNAYDVFTSGLVIVDGSIASAAKKETKKAVKSVKTVKKTITKKS